MSKSPPRKLFVRDIPSLGDNQIEKILTEQVKQKKYERVLISPLI